MFRMVPSSRPTPRPSTTRPSLRTPGCVRPIPAASRTCLPRVRRALETKASSKNAKPLESSKNLPQPQNPAGKKQQRDRLNQCSCQIPMRLSRLSMSISMYPEPPHLGGALPPMRWHGIHPKQGYRGCDVGSRSHMCEYIYMSI